MVPLVFETHPSFPSVGLRWGFFRLIGVLLLFARVSSLPQQHVLVSLAVGPAAAAPSKNLRTSATARTPRRIRRPQPPD